MKRIRKLHFGPAGIPNTVKGKSIKEGVIEVKRLRLDAMEIEFVRRISLNEKSAKEVYDVARSLRGLLTVHAPYYVNLASDDEDKIEKSIERVVKSAVIGAKAGAWSVCFHAGYYLQRDSEEVYRIIRRNLERVVEEVKSHGVKIWLRPETTGKPTQFGTLEEVIRLSEELDMVLPVIDFAHLHARELGKIDTYEEFRWVLEKLENRLGRTALDNMHIHISGIEYTEKGEKRHLNLGETTYPYEDLLRALIEFKVKGVVISESPNLEEDALLLKNTYERLKRTKSRK